MADFNPDEYLAKQPKQIEQFDPDKYLGGGFESEEQKARYLQSLPQLKGILAGEDIDIASTASLLTATDPNEIAQIITASYPNVSAVYPEEGAAPILINQETGVAVNTGKKGIQTTDVLSFLGLAAAYTPAGRVSGVSIPSLAKVSGQEGLTEAVIQGGQSATGGEFNVGDIATTSLLAPVGQVAGEAITKKASEMMQKGQIKDADEALASAEAEGIDVLTSDVMPPKGKAGGLVRQMAENLPVIGTSAKRARQQLQREDSTKRFLDEAGEVRFSEADIVDDLKTHASKTKNAAGNRLDAVITDMTELGEVDTDETLNLIDSLIEVETRQGKIQDEALLNKLVDIRQDLIEPQDFSTLRENRTTVRGMKDSVDPKSKTQTMTKSKSVLEQVYNSITSDLDRFVKNNSDDRYLQRYKKADEIYGSEARNLMQSRIKGVLDKGDVKPEAVNTVLFSSAPSEVKNLYKSLSVKGKDNARAAILSRIAEDVSDDVNVNPTKLKSQLKKYQDQIDIFFKGEEKQRLNGLLKALTLTQRAQDAKAITPTGLSNLLLGLASVTGSAAVGDPRGLAAAAGVATLTGLSRLYESKTARNILIKLANAKSGSPEEKELLKAVNSAIISTTAASEKSENSKLQELKQKYGF